MSNSFNEAKLEAAVIELMREQDYPHALGTALNRPSKESVLLRDDLHAYLRKRYGREGLTEAEADRIIRELEVLPASDLYASNRTIIRKVMDGFILKRDDHRAKDLYIHLIDFTDLDPHYETVPAGDETETNEVFYDYGERNTYRFVTQLEILGRDDQLRIPDGILYINGLPLVVFEFKSAVREEVQLVEAYTQLTVRYKRDIPQLFKYNAFCIISDGVNTKAGSLFAPYEFFYGWRRVENDFTDRDGIDALYTMVWGMLEQRRLRDIIRNFIFFPDTAPPDHKILCRYPQYYAARALYENILGHQRPLGDGKGGTYFGATGCGKSYTMLFLTRLLMKSVHLRSPTIVLITDRTDLDDQLSGQFESAQRYIGDQSVRSVTSRADLREQLGGRKSGGVFLTTIHKFNEDTDLLSARTNIICISDEAHRSQINLDQKVTVTDQGVRKRYGFAYHLHESLPNATYVGFTGTPVDATLDVFGPVVESYTMTESVKDGITVGIVREGRSARVALRNSELERIEEYYARAAEEGANEHQIEESKRATSSMSSILGNPERLQALAEDFVAHYERRVSEGATVIGKAMFVCSTRQIAYAFYQQVIALRPEWAEVPLSSGEGLGEREIKPMARVKMIMTRDKDDPEELYDALGTKDYRKELDRQFKEAKSNFKIAIVVDMWLTGFDVPFLDSIYIDKPIQRHNLIQTISRVNRRYAGKEKGLVVDYIGIKRQLNLAMALYGKGEEKNLEEVDQSIVALRDQLDLLRQVFHRFDSTDYFHGTPLQQLEALRRAGEYVQVTQTVEKRFLELVKRMKAAYDICTGSEALTQEERDHVHFYLAVRSIIHKLTKGDAPDTAQMNARVREMIDQALASDGVEELFTFDGQDGTQDIFSDDYLKKLEKIKLPNTRIKLLQQLLKKAIDIFRKVNRAQGINFSDKLRSLVERYNDRTENDMWRGEVMDEFTDEIMDLIRKVRTEWQSYEDLGIDFEEKAFYDILKQLCAKYDFKYPEDKLLILAQEVKKVVDDKAKYTDWHDRADIQASLKMDLIILLANHGYPPIDRDEVYREIFEQAESYKRNR